MSRNLDRRVEILYPIEDLRLIHHLRDEVLATYLADNVKARRMRSDGCYDRVKPEPDEPALNSQAWFIERRVSLAQTKELASNAHYAEGVT